MESLDELAALHKSAPAPNFLTSELPGFRLLQGGKMFSPYAVKAGTAQGEEEGEGILYRYPHNSL